MIPKEPVVIKSIRQALEAEKDTLPKMMSTEEFGQFLTRNSVIPEKLQDRRSKGFPVEYVEPVVKVLDAECDVSVLIIWFYLVNF